MHIAICDDNIADRKQLERLLSRESDRRLKTSGNLYLDSFGSVTALMHAPMLYDLFFIDYHSDSYTGMDLAAHLRHAGVTVPIVLCSGTIDYTAFSDAPDHILHIKKPIQVKELTDIISTGLEIHAQNKPPISIQGEKETFYLPEENFLYANEIKHTLYVHTASGEVFMTLGKMADLSNTLENNDHFCRTGKHSIINLLHVTAVRSGSLTLDNQTKIRFPFWKTGKIKLYWHYAVTHNT